MSQAIDYIRALDAAARAWSAGRRQEIEQLDARAYDADKAFDAAGKRSHDYPGVQAAERRYHVARGDR